MPRLTFILVLCVLLFSCEKKVETAATPEQKKGYWTAEDKIRTKKPNARPIIIIDAGHGGNDPGGLSNHDSVALNVKEKDIALLMSEMLFRKLDKEGFNVIRVRKKDEFIHRHDRTNLLEHANPDLLLTLHTNSSRDTNINGFEFAYSQSMLNYVDTNKNKPVGDTINIVNPFAQLLKKYCLQLSDNTKRAFPKMRQRRHKARTDRIWMLYGVHYPSILVEFGFVTGKDDIFIYQDKKNLEKFTDVLAKTVSSFFLPVKDSFYLPPLGIVPVMRGD